MYKPKTNVTERYAFVKDEVIFKIKGSSNGDSCAVKLTKGNVPFFNCEGTLYYLDTLIEVGDKLVGEDIKTFKKVLHNEIDPQTGKEVEIGLPEYYIELCKAQIKDAIVKNYSLDYNYILEHLWVLGVPDYVIEQSGKTVRGLTQIDFSEGYYNKIKVEGIKEIALKAAQYAIEPYGYEATEVTIKKAEE